MVRLHQTHTAGHDAMPVVIHVVAKGNVEFVLHCNQVCHGIGAGTIHADLAVMVEGHEREGRVDALVDDLQVEVVALSHWLPIS